MHRSFARAIMAALALVAVALTLVSALTNPLATSDIARIQQSEMDAFEWIKANTPPDSTWALIGNGHDFYGATAEWFPVFTQRHGINILQGTEWVEAGISIDNCNQNPDCLEGVVVDYILVSHCCEQLIQSLNQPLFESNGVYIFD